jgi:hypothetical protein
MQRVWNNYVLSCCNRIYCTILNSSWLHFRDCPYTDTNVLSQGFHQSSRNGFKRRTLPFLLFHELPRALARALSNNRQTVAVNLRPKVSRPVRPGVRRPSWTCDQFFFLLEISFRQLRVCNFVAPSLTRVRVCILLYNCFWALPEQSLLGRSPAELLDLSCL